MFSLQLPDELVFAATPTTTQPYQIPQDLIIDNNPVPIHMLEDNLISFSSTTSNTQTKNSGRKGQSSRHGRSYDKRVIHRDIERKRREQTSKLYASLRALLPVEHNKGKSPVSDQTEEAANYIKQMYNKIQQLRTRRDSLKKLHNSSSSSCATNIQNSEGGNTFQNRVSVHRVSDGMEIHITKENPEFEISQALAQLSKRELDVVSCVSTRTKAGFLHKIDIKGSDMMSLDILELQNKLTEAIN